MTVGGTTATFTQSIHGRRRTIGIYRATGASPSRILRVILADAARIGVVSSVAALGLALLGLQVLEMMGYLTFFGISLHPVPSPIVITGAILRGLCVTLIGATVTTIGLLRLSPASLLADPKETAQPIRREDEL